MGVNEELSRLQTRGHQKRADKALAATQQSVTAAVDVQVAILGELQKLNEQIAWQNQALSQLLQQRAQQHP